ncbi:MAG: FAD-dependent oxidoreductase, partial [Burkholderiaceae bacterium]
MTPIEKWQDGAQRGPAAPVDDFDLIVLGSGAAGLSAALFAAAQNRRVLLAEKSDWIGGTTAMSGGCIWIPCNHHMASIGASDSTEDALRYIRAVAPPGWAASEEHHWQAFVEAGAPMLRFVETHSPLRLHVGGEPDPYLEAPGALRRGRNVSPQPFRFAHAPVRQSASGDHAFRPAAAVAPRDRPARDGAGA